MNLKDYRNGKDITQARLGELVGVKKNTICSYESKARKPDINRAKKLAEVLQVSVEEILNCF